MDAKVQLPGLVAGLVSRSSLLARFRDADASLVTVTAPAGYGKTTLLAQWAATDGRRFAWVSLDDLDDDPLTLTTSILRGLEAAGLVDQDVADDAARADFVTTLRPRLRRTMAQLPEPTVLVLDDVHLLGGAMTADVLLTLVKSVPDGSQIVLSGRSAPPIPLGSLRAGRRLFEAGAGDLAFGDAEAAELLRRAGLSLPAGQMQALIDHTEGWAGGLFLAALALRSQPDPGQAVEAFGGSHRVFAEFFGDELLTGLPADTRQFLEQTSVLERLSGPLCDAITGRRDSARLLERLHQAGNLFVVPLDDERRWYRYHHMFRDLLQAELRLTSPEAEPEVRRRASAWLEADGDLDGAVDQAVKAGDADRVGLLLLPQLIDLAADNANARVGRWLAAFDDEQIAASAPLALAAAWHMLAIPDPPGVERWLDAAETALAARGSDAPEQARLALLVGRAMLGAGGTRQVIADCESVRAAGSLGNPWWGFASAACSAALIFCGEIDRAAEMLEDVVASSAPATAAHTAALALLSLVASEREDRTTALELVRRAEEQMDQGRLWEFAPLVVVHGIAANVLQRAGEPSDALAHASQARRLLGRLQGRAPRTTIVGAVLAGDAYAGLGDVSTARTMLAEARRVLPAEPDATWLRERFAQLEQRLARSTAAVSAGVGSITPAELRLLEYMPTHLSLRQISDELYISRNTVKSHAVSIYRKLGVSSRSDAVVRARELGLITT